MLAFVNANLVKRDSIIFDGTLIANEERIVAMGEGDKLPVPESAQVIDCKGLYIGPGLIDIHTHAGGDIWFYENPAEAARVLLRHGVTAVLPALYVNLDVNQQMEAVRKIRQAAATVARNIKGLYMEGTYLNPKFGCDLASNKWVGGIDEAQYLPLVQEVGSFAKVWCIAPELNGAEQFVDRVKSILPDVIFSVAHSEATPAQVEALIGKGLRLATHHTNATGTIVNYEECRGVCVDEAVNMNDNIYAEIICDSHGIHVDPYMIRLLLKIKGRDRMILISDACVFDGPVPEKYKGINDLNFDDEGIIAGSKLTLDKACQNMMKHTGCGLRDVFQYASYNPAQLLNMHGYGQLAVGSRADLAIVDHRMNVEMVVLGGALV